MCNPWSHRDPVGLLHAFDFKQEVRPSASCVAGMAWQQPNQWNWGSSWTADGKRYYKRDADGNRVTRGYLNRQEESFKNLKEKLRLAEEKVETREKEVKSEKSEKEKLLREKLDLQAQLFRERTEKEDLRTRGRTLDWHQ